jgi:hypothetical protein
MDLLEAILLASIASKENLDALHKRYLNLK